MIPQVPPALEPRFSAYLDLLDRWNAVHALTALPREARWTELGLDACALLPGLRRLRAGGTVADLGTGMGIPAVVLALARPDLNVRALDSSRKKIAFLRQAALELGIPNLEPVAGRFESLEGPQGDLGVAKALAPMGQLLAWWARLGAPGSPFLALKGPEWRGEVPVPGWRISATSHDLPGRGTRWVLTAERAQDENAPA
jgi:16S rRNA (guanine527-N7)-methyltransferase